MASGFIAACASGTARSGSRRRTGGPGGVPRNRVRGLVVLRGAPANSKKSRRRGSAKAPTWDGLAAMRNVSTTAGGPPRRRRS